MLGLGLYELHVSLVVAHLPPAAARSLSVDAFIDLATFGASPHNAEAFQSPRLRHLASHLIVDSLHCRRQSASLSQSLVKSGR